MATKEKTQDNKTDEEKSFMALFELFNREVDLFKVEQRSGKVTDVIGELKQIWLEPDRQKERSLAKGNENFSRS